MKVITYRLTLLEPTLVTALDGDPNSAVAFDYLPGSVLRGAIIGRYLRGKNVDPDKVVTDTDARRLFFNGTRYLNGYPLNDEKRTLPTPQSWQRKKGEETPLYDFAVEPPDDDEKQWQGISTPFCLLTDASVRLTHPERLITVHTRRTRRFGRAMPRNKIKRDETEGAVYRYDALARGQTFEAAIFCDTDADAATLLPLLAGEATLGGSRSGGYGRATFHDAKPAPATWREAGCELNPDADGKFIVTLLSDALLRDANGQFVVDPCGVTAALSVGLGGITLTLHKNKTFLRGQAIGGFNRKWGLPLPQALAVAMGSVFVYDKPNCAVSKLRELEAQGIGERRAEGFGRVVVNWHTEEKWEVAKPDDTTPGAVTITDAASRAVAESMVKRMLRQRLDAALTQRANDLGKHVKEPKNSQLSRLRMVLHDALRQSPTEGRTRLTRYLDNLEKRKNTRKQFTRDQVAGKGLLDWLKERVANESDVWSKIGIDQNRMPKIGANVPAELTATLAYEYNLRLIDGVLARAAKERRGDN